MVAIPRQELDELVTKYELHPDLFDVYVEGAFDRDFVSTYLSAVGLGSDASVYSIEGVEVPSELLVSLGLPLGSNKYRVIGLSAFLHEQLEGRATRLMCLVDADLDRILAKLCTHHHLRYTDYCCMEMYALNLKTLKHFVHLTCALAESDATAFLRIASTILPVQFAVRVTIDALDLGVTSPPFTSGLVDKRDLGTFSAEKYFGAFVLTAHLTRRSQEVRALFDDIRPLVDKDLRQSANGHDFISLLFEFIWLRGGLRLRNKTEDVFRYGGRLLLSGVDFSQLSEEPLFAALLANAGAR